MDFHWDEVSSTSPLFFRDMMSFHAVLHPHIRTGNVFSHISSNCSHVREAPRTTWFSLQRIYQRRLVHGTMALCIPGFQLVACSFNFCQHSCAKVYFLFVSCCSKRHKKSKISKEEFILVHGLWEHRFGGDGGKSIRVLIIWHQQSRKRKRWILFDRCLFLFIQSGTLSNEMCYPHLGWNFLAQFNFSGSFLTDRPRGLSSRWL